MAFSWGEGTDKLADHADDRLRERTTIPPAELAALRKRVHRMRSVLDPMTTYHYRWDGQGYAVVGPVGRKARHVVKTVLGPHMSPPGQPLPEYVSAPAHPPHPVSPPAAGQGTPGSSPQTRPVHST